MARGDEARPHRSSWGAGRYGRATGRTWSGVNAPDASYDGFLLVSHKRGRTCVLAKLAKLGDELVLAMPFGNRREVTEAVSIPMKGIEAARKHGARRWLLRFKSTGMGHTIDIDDAERLGFMRASEGRGELFVKLIHFQPCDWPEWRWVPQDSIIDLDADAAPVGQRHLFEGPGEHLA
jgi:hypothetical protein